MSATSQGLATEVVERIRVMRPGISADATGETSVLIAGRALDLDNLARMIAAAPESRGVCIDRFLAVVLADEGPIADARWVDVRGHVRAVLKPAAYLGAVQYPSIEFCNQTVIVFVIDRPTHHLTITDALRAKWRLSVDELLYVATANLAAVPFEIDELFPIEGGRGALIGVNDGYDAARLLLPDLQRQLRRDLGGDFYVGVPCRDYLIAVSAEPEPPLRRTRAKVAADYERLPYPISPRLFLVTRDGVAGTEEGGPTP